MLHLLLDAHTYKQALVVQILWEARKNNTSLMELLF